MNEQPTVSRTPLSPPVESAEDQATPPISDRRYYRLGICGLSRGGKTCILASLKLARFPHPRGLTVTMMPLDQSASEELKAGTEWVTNAADALCKGEQPPPNYWADAFRRKVRYKLTDGAHREVFLELEDYSGELLQSYLADNERAEMLRAYFREVDAFLFIAEHPRSGADAARLPPYLQHLREALAKQREERRSSPNEAPVPIALLINKWDRSGPIARPDDRKRSFLMPDPNSQKVQRKRMDAFLGSEAGQPHTGLLSELKTASGQRCRAFPVSAFGGVRQELGEDKANGSEVPVLVGGMLPSFGLEEPFDWLVSQRDEMDVERLAGQCWKFSAWCNPRRTSEVRKTLKEDPALLRMSPKTPQAARVANLRLWMSFAAVLQVVVCIAGVVGGFLFGEFLLDWKACNSARVAIYNIRDEAGWSHAGDWYQNYVESNAWRHLLHRHYRLSNQAAASEWSDATQKLDENTWQGVPQTPDPVVQARLADGYLQKFPQGKHQADAKNIMRQEDVRLVREKLRSTLDTLQKEFDTLEAQGRILLANPSSNKKSAIEELEILRDNLNHLDLAIADDELLKRRANLVAVAGSLHAQMMSGETLNQHRRDYYTKMEKGDLAGATTLLVGLTGPDFDGLRRDYLDRALPLLEKNALDQTGNGAAWKEGLQSLISFEDKKNDVLRKLLPDDADQTLGLLHQRIRQLGDRYLYELARKSEQSEHFDDYVKTAPILSMRVVVEKWQRFLHTKATPSTYRIAVKSVAWGEEARHAGWVGSACHLILSSGSTTHEYPFDSNLIGNVKPAWDQFSIDLKDIIASEPKNVNLQAWFNGSWVTSDKDLGTISFSSMLEIMAEKPRPATGSNYAKGSTATFSVYVLDGDKWVEYMRPPLPPWSAAP